MSYENKPYKDLMLNSRVINNNYSQEILNRQLDTLISNNNLPIINEQNNKTVENKRDINWGSYYFQINQKTNGGGSVRDPQAYDKLYIGENTRLDPSKELVRETDLREHSIIPLDSFRIDYGNLDYLNESRGGISTRTYKKSNSN